jgi:hypothetical protein
MSEDPKVDVPAPQPLDYARVSAKVDNFRDSMRRYVDSITTSVEKATDVNKQFSAFHERLLLIDLGTIGLSVTALTSVASKVAMIGFWKYVVIVPVGFAWFLLLLSAFMCRNIMNIFLAANRKLYDEWRMTVNESNAEQIILDLQRLSIVSAGTIHKEDLDETAAKVRNELADARKAHLQKTLQTGGAEEGLTTGQASQHAIRFMQWALMLLAVAAMVLIIAM